MKKDEERKKDEGRKKDEDRRKDEGRTRKRRRSITRRKEEGGTMYKTVLVMLSSRCVRCYSVYRPRLESY